MHASTDPVAMDFEYKCCLCQLSVPERKKRIKLHGPSCSSVKLQLQKHLPLSLDRFVLLRNKDAYLCNSCKAELVNIRNLELNICKAQKSLCDKISKLPVSADATPRKRLSPALVIPASKRICLRTELQLPFSGEGREERGEGRRGGREGEELPFGGEGERCGDRASGLQLSFGGAEEESGDGTSGLSSGLQLSFGEERGGGRREEEGESGRELLPIDVSPGMQSTPSSSSGRQLPASSPSHRATPTKTPDIQVFV